MKSDEGDAGARWMRSVMDRYEGALLRYATRILGDVERARDVVQDTFLRLWNSRGDLDPDSPAEWLFTVCRNRALDVCRKERRMTRLTEPMEQSRCSPDPSPTEQAERHEAAEEIAHALGQLSDRQQEVLRLKFQNGFSYRQIARITGMSVSNVGFLIHTAIGRIRTRLRSAGFAVRT